VPGFVEIDDGFLLQIARVNSGPIVLAGDDDRKRLLALASEISGRASAVRASDSEASIAAAPVEVVEEESRDVVSDRNELPPNSKVIVERHADGVTITVPPAGLRGLLETRLILALVVIAVGLCAWITVAGATAVAKDGFIGVFTFEGALMVWPAVLILAANFVLATRQSGELAARSGVLTVRWTGLFGTRQRIWHRDELAELCAVSERIQSEGAMEWSQFLSIRPHKLSKPGPRCLFDWLTKAELEWIATTLRHALWPPSNDPALKPTAPGWDDEFA
jgi:hypothetical protein